MKLVSKELFRSWVVWLFPVLAAIVTGSLYFRYWETRGPLIKILFSDAVGMEVQKTTLRYRGVIVGRVENIHISKDARQVLVAARLHRDAKSLAVSGTKFMLVQPQVNFEGVRGLETLFKGPYIRIEPGSGSSAREFRGLSGSEVTETVPSVNFRVTARFAESLNPGDAIFYRGVKVGQISGLKINPTGQNIDIIVSIERGHRWLIRKNTTFWQKAAIYAKAGLFGTEVKINSLESVLKGGISFATPEPPGVLAPANWGFFLEENPPRKWEKWEPELPRQ